MESHYPPQKNIELNINKENKEEEAHGLCKIYVFSLVI